MRVWDGMTQYLIEATSPTGNITVEEPLTLVEAYEKASQMRAQGFHGITLTDVATGHRTPNVEKLIPYPDL